MSAILAAIGTERVILFGMFLMYMLTSVQICRYSSWVKAGAPNPFLPRRVKQSVSHRDIAMMLNAEMQR